MVVVRISIQAAHEQVNPSDLLHDVIYMDQNRIERCWTSDHYMPWWHVMVISPLLLARKKMPAMFLGYNFIWLNHPPHPVIYVLLCIRTFYQ